MNKEILEPQSFKQRVISLAPRTRTKVSTFELARTVSGLQKKLVRIHFTKDGYVRKATGRIQFLEGHIPVMWNRRGECTRTDKPERYYPGDLDLKEVES